MRKLISLLLATIMVLGCASLAFADGAALISEGPQTKGIPAIYSGICADTEGSIYLTDTNAKVIKTIGTSGDATVFAGKSSIEDINGIPLPDYNDGKAEEATFASPWDMTPYLDGFAVSDSGNAKLRYVANGSVQTINIAATLSYPTGLATDDKGNLYVSDTGADKILVIDTKGKVIKTITGLCEPTGLCWYDGTLYIAETGKNRIQTYTSGTGLKVLSGQAVEDGDGYLGGFANGKAENAKFARPEGVLAAADGIYVADSGNAAVRLIKDGRVTTFALGSGDANDLQSPRDLAVVGDTLFVTDSFNGLLHTISISEANSAAFTDVKENDWFAASVKTAKTNGLIAGYSDGSFKPQADVTRAQFATMLANMMLQLDGQLVIGGTKDFADVADTDWFANYVRWAGDMGFMAGSVKDGKTYAKPADTLTREQLVTMLYNVAEGQKLTVTASKTAAMDNYPDADKMSAYAAIPMEWALSAGLLSGYGDGTLRPTATVTRAQAASMLTSFLEAIGF